MNSWKRKRTVQLDDSECTADFGFLTDILTYLNNLNLQLHGQDQLFTISLPSKKKAFEIKL